MNPSLPWMRRKSHMLANIILNMPPIIHDGELLVGYNYYGDDGGMWNEVHLYPRQGEQREQLARYLRMGSLNEEQIEFILNTLDNIDKYLPHTRYILEQPEEVREATEEGILWAWGTPDTHTIINYEKVLKMGFAGIREEIDRLLSNLDWSDPDTIHKKLLLECAGEVVDAARTIGRRYADKADEMLAVCKDAARRRELAQLREILYRVPEYPAASFREALQSLWFAHIINTWEDGINANSLGRLDQVLYPYYKKDLEEGRITREEAFELLCCLWIKLYRDYDVQQVALGGVTAEGKDATNELTYLMLDVTEALDFIRCISVRLHKESPMELIRRSLDIVKKGQGIPFFFNDDVLIPALVDSGIPVEDARDYAAIGCVEITIPGKANPHAVSNRVNLLKCLELALNNGVSLTTGKAVGLKTGDISEMESMDDIITAYEKQVEYFVALACFESNRCELANSFTVPMIYKSILTEGCLESGRDFNAGGAKYNYHESMAMGIPNVADSLAAIEKLVFERKRYTLAEVLEHMRKNFPDERVRQEFLKFPPKYGNDEDEVDRYGAQVTAHFCETVRKQKGLWGMGFFAQPFTFLWLVEAGEKTGATPDGRRKGENLAYSVSPMQGRDYKGLTALINSLAKLPHHMAAGSTSAIIEVDPVLFNDDNLDWMAILVKTAVDMGVGQMQFNVVSAETLEKAQREPDKYRNLAVRVSGFSQRFSLLDKKLQDHIIARTKHQRR
jgi:formate C-acetyltransferase